MDGNKRELRRELDDSTGEHRHNADSRTREHRHDVDGQTRGFHQDPDGGARHGREAGQSPVFRGGSLVDTEYGKLEGARDPHSGSLQWLGVPYAKPPVGELRWKAPREPEAWGGIRLANEYGSDSLQLFMDKAIGDEDCLYLNVWRPDDAGEGLPVLVFAHGGGNQGGSGRDFYGGELARETRSVVVSVNYRLGAMGFFRHPVLRTGDPLDDSGNYGLLDLIQSLRWVQANIAGFGGDPDRVTLAGQSAGARNALAAMISPCARGLFRQALILSGGMTTAGAAQGDAKGEEVAARALAEAGRADTAGDAGRRLAELPQQEAAALLRSLDAERYASALGPAAIRMEPFPHLFEDGTVVPEGGFHSGEPAQAPDGSPVPVMLGSLATEFSTFALWDPSFIPFVQDGSLMDDPERRKLYEAAVRYGSELYAGFNAERVAEWLTRQREPSAVFAYRFGWGTRDGVIDERLRFLLGANHGADVPFFTGDETAARQNHPQGYFTDANEPGRRELTAILRGYVRGFLHAGDPNGEGLPAWCEWSNAEGAARLLKLDAQADRACVGMSEEYFRNGTTLAAMEADPSLTAERRAWIRERLFEGRFFWNDEEPAGRENPDGRTPPRDVPEGRANSASDVPSDAAREGEGSAPC